MLRAQPARSEPRSIRSRKGERDTAEALKGLIEAVGSNADELSTEAGCPGTGALAGCRVASLGVPGNRRTADQGVLERQDGVKTQARVAGQIWRSALLDRVPTLAG